MFSAEMYAAFPYVVLSTAALMLLLVYAFRGDERGVVSTLFAVFSTVVALWGASTWQYLSDPAFDGMLSVDSFGFVCSALILGGAIIALLLNFGSLGLQGVSARGDADVLILLASMGGMMMVGSSHLIVIFIGLELLSVSVYILSGLARKTKASSEAALKYFLLGAFSSAFLLYGMTLLYGATGSMELTRIGAAVRAGGVSPLFVAGAGLLVFGFAFKAALVPFHFWTPDVYQGAPVSITTFMAVSVKAAAIGAFIRVLAVALPNGAANWPMVVAVLSALSMTIGNLLALRQTSLKRLLAYSSISHAGYAVMGLTAGNFGGFEAALFYLFAYGFMTAGSFAVVLAVTARTEAQYGQDDLSTLNGLGWKYPLLGFVMTIAVLSLAGIPPLAGFFGKLYLFVAVVKSGYTWLAILAALNSAVSLYYYLGILVTMYFKPEQADQPVAHTPASRLVLATVTAGTIVLGILSTSLLTLTQDALRTLPRDVPQYNQSGDFVTYTH